MKKLIEALHTIQDECEENDTCLDCQFWLNEQCLFDIRPDDWEINNVQKALLWKEQI